MLEVESGETPGFTRRLVPLLPGISGLVVGGVVALSSGLPPRVRLPWTELLGIALQRTFEVSLASVLTAAMVCAVMSRRRKVRTDRIILHTSIAALWLLPLAICFAENSAWTVAVAGIFSLLVTGSFLRETNWDASEFHAGESPSSRPSYAEMGHRRWPEEFVSVAPSSPQTRVSVVSGLCIQIAAILSFAGYSVTAALLAAITCGIWVWSYALYAPLTLQPACGTKPFQRRGLLVSGLAVLFTFTALLPYVRKTGGWGRQGAYPWHAGARSGSAQPRRARIAETPTTGSDEGNVGIVLWPEKQVVTKLVVPTPTRDSLSLTNFHNANPLIVPFNGVYWFFKAPDVQPPRNSRQAHASPDALEIRSTDRRPLSIEAYDHLGTLVDLGCCSKIQIAIRNADRYPESVFLELVLINTSLPQKPAQSLGSLMVKSTRPWEIWERPKAVSETLSFMIPAKRSLRRFDEMKIVFRLDRARADAAAKIAIDHFVLVPRGF